jgi:hypothetical protein
MSLFTEQVFWVHRSMCNAHTHWSSARLSHFVHLLPVIMELACHEPFCRAGILGVSFHVQRLYVLIQCIHLAVYAPAACDCRASTLQAFCGAGILGVSFYVLLFLFSHSVSPYQLLHPTVMPPPTSFSQQTKRRHAKPKQALSHIAHLMTCRLHLCLSAAHAQHDKQLALFLWEFK